MAHKDPQEFLAHQDQQTEVQGYQERQVLQVRLVVRDLQDLEGRGQLEYREHQDLAEDRGLLEYREDQEILEFLEPKEQLVYLDLKETQGAPGLEVLVPCQGRQDLLE
jgi:hypothetical protein